MNFQVICIVANVNVLLRLQDIKRNIGQEQALITASGIVIQYIGRKI